MTQARLLRALARQPVDRPPVWLMRQAGRYLPEYRATRKQAGDFMTLCTTPELACEVSLQPLRRFPLDAAIIFSDILVVPYAMGMALHVDEGRGPWFEQPVRDKRAIEALKKPDPNQELQFVMSAISLLKQELKGQVPIIGFAGSPWTLATYMIEGGSSQTYETIKTMAYQAPELLTNLLERLAESVTLYLQAQVEAGAQALMIFDTWGSVLSAANYQKFSLAFMRKIVASLNAKYPHIPVILFTKAAGAWLESLADSGAQAIGVDWTIDLGEARRRTQGKVAIQGNIDPAVLYASPEVIQAEVKACLAAYGDAPGHIFNLGHGIPKNVDPEHVAVLVEAVTKANII